MIIFSGSAFGQLPGLSASAEYEVKAAFLFHFAKFIDWPSEVYSDPATPISIGVIGQDPFGNALEKVIGDKKIKGRNLIIRRYQDINEINFCHVFFIAESESAQLENILSHLNGQSVLTVGDMDGFAQRGGIIRLFVQAKKVRFKINLDAAERVRLKISAKLLNLAQIVHSEG